jgi:diacylglycerol kinase family enzyme
MAGIGLDAAVAGAVDPDLKKRLGKGAFAVSALRFIWDWHLPPVRIELPGEELVGRFVVAGNAHSYGGGFRITPTAELDDPNLDLCVFNAEGRIPYLRFAVAAALGMHRGLAGVTYRKVRAARITPLNGEEAPVQLDGEVTGGLPLQLEAIPDGVKLLV